MNIKVFENDDRLVIEISGANLKTKINENTILEGLLKSLLQGQGIIEIPGLAPVEETQEISTEGMKELPPEPFSFNGKEINDLNEEEKSEAGFALLKYRKRYGLSDEEQDFLKQFAYAELCFVEEDKMDESVIIRHLELAGETPDAENVRTQYRKLIDDTINSIWK